MLKVGIIDSGASLPNLRLTPERASGVHLFRNDAGDIVSTDDINDRLGHGTACMSAILRDNPDVSFYVVKIFDREWTADPEVLVAALQYCIDQQVDIINVSLGIQQNVPGAGLTAVCREAGRRNIPIVAAGRLDDKICFPACLPEVIGVGCIDSSAPVELVYIEQASVAFYMKGMVILDTLVYFGTSFACAKVTAEILLLMKEMFRPSCGELKTALIDRALRVQPSYPFRLDLYHTPPESIPLKERCLNPVAAYPFAEHVLVLPLADQTLKALFADAPVTTGRLRFHYREHAHYAEDVPSILPPEEYYAAFDTVVLGRLRSLLTFYNCRPVYQQLRVLLKKNKHFIVYDEGDYNILRKLKAECDSASTVCLSGYAQQCNDILQYCNDLPPLHTPVLSVVGTKVTDALPVQVRLNTYLASRGYETACVSPVKEGELTGAVFSCDMDNAFSLSDAALQRLLRAVQTCTAPDLILTGLPGALLPVMTPDDTWTARAGFMRATQPDAVIIVVSEDVPLENIMNNYYAIKGITGTQRYCFLLPDEPDRAVLAQQLKPFGTVLFAGNNTIPDGMEKVLKGFFSGELQRESTRI
ncbi:S8 family serine peptidase [Chitinophaga oryzae]|uniref:S8 family serine peptidase n=1 Tax=Chitinophaga oryzae TaxID=2725414 RepID=A0AAE7D7B4_9BACT|nr:S8 family serine peptidase [Chitinophaga oryzae]QJB32207.1 S8 family serine peptidase [Chitinophaga oryzae]